MSDAQTWRASFILAVIVVAWLLWHRRRPRGW